MPMVAFQSTVAGTRSGAWVGASRPISFGGVTESCGRTRRGLWSSYPTSPVVKKFGFCVRSGEL